MKKIIVFVFLLFLFSNDLSSDETFPNGELVKNNGYYMLIRNNLPAFSPEKQKKHIVFSLSGVWRKKRFNGSKKLSLRKRTERIIKLLEEESNGAYKREYDDLLWEKIRIPGVENPPPDRYQGCVWYRRNFEIPKKYIGKKIVVRFFSVNYVADVWVNGVWVGSHEGGYTPFACDITDVVEEKNTIAVRVCNIPWIPHGNNVKNSSEFNSKDIIPYKTCDWWNYGGITRDVFVEVFPDISVANAFVCNNGENLKVIAWIMQNKKIREQLFIEANVFNVKIDEDNILSEDASKICERKIYHMDKEKLKMQNSKEVFPYVFFLPACKFKKWFPDEPNLYVLNIKIYKDNILIEDFYTQFGIKNIGVDREKNKINLNGKNVYLRGVARHEVFPGTDEKCKGRKGLLNDFSIIKNLNANFIRTAHYPNHPFTYILADRMGIAIWEEIPVFWFDGPQFLYQTNRKKLALQMWIEMLLRDFNRVSVLFWSSCNESTKEDKKERLVYFNKLKALLKKLGASGLFVQSAVGDDLNDYTQKECDIAGITCYWGIFYGKDYYIDTINALKKMYVQIKKPILITEFGIWSEKDLSNSWNQVEVALETYDAFRDLNFICGTCWWTAFDWHTMISEPQTMGLVRWDRKTFKPVYFALQRIYANLINDKLFIKVFSPSKFEKISGKVVFEGISSEKTGKINIEVADKKYTVEIKNGKFDWKFNTRVLDDGEYKVIFKYDNNEIHYWDYCDINIQNEDDPPKIEIITDKKGYTGECLSIVAKVEDDFGIKDVILIDKTSGKEKKFNNPVPQIYCCRYDLSFYDSGDNVEIGVKAHDSGGNVSEEKLILEIDKTERYFVKLPYNFDWIAEMGKERDANDFYNYPAEILPCGGKMVIFNCKSRIYKFLFPSKVGEEFNCMECFGQKVEVKTDYYKTADLLLAMHNGSEINEIIFEYENGYVEKKQIGVSDWWMGVPHYGEDVVIRSPYYNEVGNKKKPLVAMYAVRVELKNDLRLKRIIFPVNDRLHIFALTLNRKE